MILDENRQNGRTKLVPALAVLITASLISLIVITAAAAAPSDDINSLEAQSAELDNSYNQALQELVAIDTEVQRSGDELAAARQRSSEVAAEIAAQEQNLAELQAQLGERQTALEKRITSSYKSDDLGYLEVVMNAGDFSEFLTRVDMVNKIAEEDQKLITSFRDAETAVEAELASLNAKREELVALEKDLAAAEQELLAAQSEQAAYVSSLEGELAANQNQLAQLQAEAAAIEANMSAIQSQSSASSSGGGGGGGDYGPPAAGGSSLTVTATAYCLTGRTATGMPAGPGVIAVDPGVIPLGSSVYVTGYGNAIAADTGGAIVGNKIDVWLPCGDAYAWGVRTVNVTIY